MKARSNDSQEPSRYSLSILEYTAMVFSCPLFLPALKWMKKFSFSAKASALDNFSFINGVRVWFFRVN